MQAKIAIIGVFVGALLAGYQLSATAATGPTSISFTLPTDPAPVVTSTVGSYQVAQLNSYSLTFGANSGVSCNAFQAEQSSNPFNYDTLYKVTANGQAYYFRFGWQDCSTSGVTKLTYLTWANGKMPSSTGVMTFQKAQKDIIQNGTRAFATVGDNITGSWGGQSLRIRLAILNNDLKFIGSHTDIYGYGHEALRGNTTRDVMNRLGSIVASDNYLLNIGNNDWRYISEAETVNNIKQITSSLLAKKSGATVHVMTLLPRKDSYDARNQRISQQLRDWIAAQSNTRIKLVDLDKDFRALSSWSSLIGGDGVQPTTQGYVELAKIINKYVSGTQTSTPTTTTPSGTAPSGPSSVSFTLGLSPAPVVTSTVGSYQVNQVSSSAIIFGANSGVSCNPDLAEQSSNAFNYDTLYKVTANGQAYYFRFGWQDCSTSGVTKLTFLNWANGKMPSGTGVMTFQKAQKDITQNGTRIFATVGDSLSTSWSAQSLRIRMVILNPYLKFIGSRTDTYGYGHEARRGNTTRDVMNRLGSIVPSDNYLLNIGTNDWRSTSETETVENIKQITSALLAKKSGATVYVMTILPRKDSVDARNQRINQQLRNWIAAQGNSRIKLLDSEKDFRALSNWSSLVGSDGVHLVPQGYAELAKIINRYL